MEKQEELLNQALREVDWINFGRVVDSLVKGHPWGRYDNKFVKPNFNKAVEDSAWLAKNAASLGELFQNLAVGAKVKRNRKK